MRCATVLCFERNRDGGISPIEAHHRSRVHEFKHGELKSGPGGKGGPVKSCWQAIASALEEAGASKYETDRRNRHNLVALPFPSPAVSWRSKNEVARYGTRRTGCAFKLH
jgi:hypothetical protein